MSSYNIPHGSARDPSSSTCSTIQINKEMQQLCATTILEDGEQVETPENPFVIPANIHTIEAFMNRVGYQGVIDKTNINILHLFHAVINQTNVDYAALLWWDFMNNKFPNIPKRIEEDFHSIKDDVPLVSVYTTGNVSVQGMLIPDAFLTAVIQETDDFKKYETVFMKVSVPMNQLQPVVSTQGTNRNTPRAHRSPTVFANHLEIKKRKQTANESSSPRKSLKIMIKQKKIVKKDDDDDSKDRMEPGSHKENPEFVVDDDDDDKEEEKQNDDIGSLEIRNEETQTTIPTPPSSPRKILSSDNKIDQKLTDIVSIPTTTTSKHSHVKKLISSKYSNLPGGIETSCVNWERVYDFQLGIKSYQIKVNLTAPTLTFPGIEEHAPYSIVDKPDTGLIYLNNKDEKRLMYLVEIVKFCDATLEKVLKGVKLRMFESIPEGNFHASKLLTANEDMGIFYELMTNSTDDEASARKIYIELGSTSGIRACRETLNDEVPPPPPPQTQTPTQQAPHTVLTIKLPLLKKGEYDIWAMKMEHYLAHIDYPIWEVIQKVNGPRKAWTTLLMAIPEDHRAKFQKMTDAKEMWEAMKSRFGGNDESKKMQKYILKQQFEGFFVSNSEGLHKGVDNLSFDDLYNNIRVFEYDVKGSTTSSSSMQNVVFVSENTNSTNEVSTAYGASNSSGQNP
ncbi:hypothetical protein Tco_0765246 [Tanacetum coccineum]